MSNETTEAMIQRKDLTATRITPGHIDEAIWGVYYLNAGSATEAVADPEEVIHESLGLLTLCVIVLKNGFTVVGKSACASPENYDEEIGRRVALDDAKRQVWPLLGYALRERLHRDVDKQPGAA